MCSLQEHTARSARENEARQQEAPIFAQTAKDHGFIFWPSLIPVQPDPVDPEKSAARSFLDQTAL
jgi:hypothetical protein